MADRVSQQATETLLTTTAGKLRATQQAVETLDTTTTGALRASQQAIEILSPSVGNGVTQQATELLVTGTSNLRTTQQAAEILVPYIPPLTGPTVNFGTTSNYYSSEAVQKGPKRFRITQITNQIQGEDYTQILRVERMHMSQDWNFGIGANIGLPQSTNATAIVTQSGFIKDVSLNNLGGPTVHVVTNGQPLKDQSFEPYVFQWDGSPLTIGVTVANVPSGGAAYIWRWMFIAEDVYHNGFSVTGHGGALSGGDPYTIAASDLYGTLTGSNTLPYDVRADQDTTTSRRFWWPLMRCANWLTVDGTQAITSDTTLIDTWSNGPGIPSGSWTSYGNLVVGKNDFFGDQTAGFSGQALWASGTPAASQLGTSSTMKYGVDFGKSFTTAPIYYGIRNKQTPCYLNILVATTAGTAQYKKIPFMLVAGVPR